MQEQETTSNETVSGNEENALPIEEQVVDDSTTFVRELEEQKEKYIRLLAEFENFKRRTAKERIELFKTAGQEVIKDLLPSMDDVDRAEQAIAEAKDMDAMVAGLKLISEKFRNTLMQKGLKEIECKGMDFNTDSMEAITEIEAGEKMKGKVVDVVEKGYTLNEKIIRYAKVIVGK